ncbi:hypothetical protein SCLCIDRAFT_154519 [Scleroderma citrinum Foug A]|uniref:Uncharacterized protein n=1 Tax=Scleroderma citrinum Foug A TaxID=1036808 RepID=A0A0C3A9Y6_9AGAM|nr:hypothetical protein SCLCIDRAFT_154519 [Scleroderma citrinum Foug A]
MGMVLCPHFPVPTVGLDGLGAAATLGEGDDVGNPLGIVPRTKSNIHHHHSGPYAALSARSWGFDSISGLHGPSTHARTQTRRGHWPTQ